MTALSPIRASQETTRVRPMELRDLQPVQAIDQLCFSMPWPASAFRYELIENAASLLWVAESGTPEAENPVVGMIVVWLIVDEVHIANIAVHPEYRRRGIAKRLLQTALQEALRQGFRTATLEVRAGNLAAQNLYRSFGFEIVGRRPRYYKDNYEDALIMTSNPIDAGEDWDNPLMVCDQ